MSRHLDKHINAVIFDLGGVIVDVDISPLAIGFFPGLARDEAKTKLMELETDELIENFQTGRTASNEFYESICNKCALHISFKEFTELWNSLFSLKEGMRDLLTELNGNTS